MPGFIIISTCAILMLCYWQHWRRTHRRMLELAKLVPGPPAWPVIGNALWFLVKPGQKSSLLEAINKLTNQYGDYLRFWLGVDLNIVVKNPADIRLLLTSNKVNQKGPVYELMKTYIGPGILTGGKSWRNHRKIAMPSYNKKSVTHFAAVFNTEADALTKVLCQKDPDVTFNVYDDVVRTTTQCVCQTLMGLSKEDSLNVNRMDELIFVTHNLYRHIFDKMTLWWLQIPLIYWLVGAKKAENHYLKLLDDFTTDILNKRKKCLESGVSDEDTMGIVDRYILSGELSEQEIKWETISLFTTSQEAAAKITSGVLMFLAHLPEWQDRVYNEIVELLGSSGSSSGSLSSEQLKQLRHLDMVYMETLRYFSIAAMVQRTVEEEVTIHDGKITLPAGTSLVIPIHELHRDPRYWEEPSKVKPERFLPDNVKKRDPNAFVPFSLGAMDCLGRVYATALIKTLVVKVLTKVQLIGTGSGGIWPPPLEVAISVRAERGYHVRIKPRRQNEDRVHA